MNITNQLTSIFCELDDFCKDLDQFMKNKLLGSISQERGPKPGLSDSEIMTILIMFHHIRMRDFKTFYTNFVKVYWQSEFPNLPSYSRFITLIKRVLLPLAIFACVKSGKQTGIYYVDSTCLPVCHLRRSKRHRTFKEKASYGATSVGWFFGFKLHLVVNHHGELMSFKLTSGKRHDSKEAFSLLKKLKGLAFGDKGYIGKALKNNLLERGLKLITRKRKNMKPEELNPDEKYLLNQRGIIETVIGHLKCHYNIWHTRHRSSFNAMTHLVAGLAAYAIEPLKISAIKMMQKMN